MIDALSRDISRRFNAAIERDLRAYLQLHRTTRLDIELHMHPFETMPEIIQTLDGRYEIQIARNYRIAQKLPVRFRPALP